MLALVFDEEPALRNDHPRPTPAEGQALLAVRSAGICTTDLQILAGYMSDEGFLLRPSDYAGQAGEGFRGVMGHEFVATVAAGAKDRTGKRVVAEINCPCGRCDMCGRGLPKHCPNRTVLGIDGRDGVFAEYVAVPVANLHELPDSISDDQAVFVEPLAAAFQILHQVEIRRSDSVVVLGDGRLGQLIARVLKGRSDRLLMVGRHEGKLNLAQEQGIEAAKVEKLSPSAASDVVIDATGRAAGFDLAMRMARPTGTIVLKSTLAGPAAMNLAPLVINEVTVVGSRCGPFPEAIAALAAGEIEVSDLITARFPLQRGLDALAAAASGENIKVIIDVQ